VKPISYKKSLLALDLPKRLKTDSKVQGGRVGVIAGSPGMWGAALLVAQAASRSGAGYVYLLMSTSQNLLKHPDFLATSESHLKKVTLSSAVIGPGYQRPHAIKKWIHHWKKIQQKNVILDAEALNWLANNPRETLPEDWVLTPHEGEMGRLLKKSRMWVHKNREESVLLAQKKWRCIVVLKGATTLVADKKHVYKIISGNPALGKAGSGDVLAGMIAAFLAQKQLKQSLVRTVCAATFVHGWIADQWMRSQKDVLSLRPTDLIEELPYTLATLRKTSQSLKNKKKVL
jgi:NAD(P)H-hydrate epimerase